MSDTGHEYDDELSIEFVILSQILMIANLSTRIYSSTRSEWQANALNYISAIEALEATCTPYLSRKYAAHISITDKKYHDRLAQYQLDKAALNDHYLRKGQNYEMGLTLAYANLKFKYIQKDLEVRGILRRRTASAMDDGSVEDGPGTIPPGTEPTTS